MPRYLRYLLDRLATLGGTLHQAVVSDLTDVQAETDDRADWHIRHQGSAAPASGL